MLARALLSVPVIVVVVSALVLASAPARADSVTWGDAAGDAGPIPYLDLQSVAVKNTASSIRVTYTSRSSGNRDGTEVVLLDTDPRRPGPELQVGFGRYSESWVTPMRNWKRDRSAAAKQKWNPNPFGKPRRCDSTVRLKTPWKRAFSPTTVTVRKKKGCITGKRVRVSVNTATTGFNDHTRSDQFGTVVRDHLPNGSRALTGWVRQRSVKARATRFVDGPDAMSWWSDISSVTTDYTASKLRVTVNHGPRPVYRQGTVTVHVDTNGDGLPDLILELRSSGATVKRADGWTPGQTLACQVDGQLAPVGLASTTVAVPTAGCLGDPPQVRVAVSAVDTTSSVYAPTDWLGGDRAWSAAVPRG